MTGQINFSSDQWLQRLRQCVNSKPRPFRAHPVALTGYLASLKGASKQIGVKVNLQQAWSACRRKNFRRSRKPNAAPQKVRAVYTTCLQGRPRDLQAGIWWEQG